MSAPDLTRMRLLNRARSIGAALEGIQTIAELLCRAQCHRETYGDTPGAESLTPAQTAALIATVAVLAENAHVDIASVIDPDDPIGADGVMTWGALDHRCPTTEAAA
ncbi:hypothetical protein [uncultured Lamprocystis sp.]|uniref:hypothetical protein n=1 Tax=uncultured Lamprocystis sp. TaxID=543132 RepID=UPI0025CEA144|nr:hypothetical protein [uncultured Lamprocystis sp.]